ncbi:HAD-like domain-containing protein [Auriculariales sp. MPI-PUGE-AT-0066]|nr:HAD-like domain-containing protein [Auriculariales sp. MPI-PUGE-AT-0066]
MSAHVSGTATPATTDAEVPPESTLPYPPLHENASFVVLSDWDGTITTFDSNDHLTDNYGMGYDARRVLSEKMLAGTLNFRDGFGAEINSVASTLKWDEAKEIVAREVQIDSTFAAFESWCAKHEVPVVVVSSGMEPFIRAVLNKAVGEEQGERHIDIIANDADVREDGSWNIKFRHPTSGFGHDKSQAIKPYRALPSRPFLFFFGDGVSDLSAARHADLLFVKQKSGENDLAAYCRREGIPFVLFEDFGGALKAVKAIVTGEMTREQVLALEFVRA